MRILRRNSTTFRYKAYEGQSEVLKDGKHTGKYEVQYADPVEYRGNISLPNGAATDNLFGLNTPYTHVLIMDNPKADIKETGLIEWQGILYEITAVRPSLNVLSAALKKRTAQTILEPPAATTTQG